MVIISLQDAETRRYYLRSFQQYQHASCYIHFNNLYICYIHLLYTLVLYICCIHFLYINSFMVFIYTVKNKYSAKANIFCSQNVLDIQDNLFPLLSTYLSNLSNTQCKMYSEYSYIQPDSCSNMHVYSLYSIPSVLCTLSNCRACQISLQNLKNIARAC